MNTTVKRNLVLGAALSAAFACPLRLDAATQGEISTTITTISPTTDRAPRTTGAESFFAPAASGGSLAAPPFSDRASSGNCPTGNCPLAPLRDDFATRSEREADLRAQSAPELRSVVRVYNERGETIPSANPALGPTRRAVVEKGSGAFVADATGAVYALTAAHIFRDGRGTISVESVDGRRFSATLATASDEYDVALLRLDDANANVPTLTVSRSWPQQGERVWRAGFGPNETLQATTGIVEGYVKTSRNDAYETLKIVGVARQGDSGGPICNASGEIVGVLWGTDGVDVYATYSARILKTLGDYSSAFAPIDVDAQEPAESVRIAKPTVPLRRNRDAFDESDTAASAVAAVERRRPSFLNVWRDGNRFFWNAALAVVLFLAVGCCCARTAKEA